MSSQQAEHANGTSLKVAICITGLEVGGAETFLAELLKHKPDDFEVRVYSLIDGGPIAERIAALGIEVTGLHMQAGHPSFRALFALSSELRTFKPDIVHTWMYHADLIGGVAAKMAGVRHVIWHLHNSDLSPERVRLMTRLVVRTCAVLSYVVPDRIVSCSQAGAVVHKNRGYSAKRIVVISNGVDTARFLPSTEARDYVRRELHLDSQASLIGLVARIDPQKNHRGFFDAARIFFAEGADSDFLLVGRGVTPDDWQLPGWRDETGHPGRITLAGPRNDVPRVMASLDVATSTSLGEAFPIVLIEAMACGIPCVATDVGDSALIVGDTGIVVPADDPKALAHAWERLLTLPAGEREALGRRARDRVVENYSIDYIADRFWALYREVRAN